MTSKLQWAPSGVVNVKGRNCLLMQVMTSVLTFLLVSVHRCAGLCVLCQKPVTRLLQWCPICGHGGHSACLQQWFAENLVCPSGCGHRCTMKCH
jgi:hypothetical protein